MKIQRRNKKGIKERKERKKEREKKENQLQMHYLLSGSLSPLSLIDIKLQFSNQRAKGDNDRYNRINHGESQSERGGG